MAAVSQHAMRRHPGGPLDPSSSIGSPYYAISQVQDKSKKSWSQRLKITKKEKQPDYSENESALSRSMKYADPWLCGGGGTVRGYPTSTVSDNRQQMFSKIQDVTVLICSCPEYISGTKRDFKKATICKKCKGSRLPLAPIGGTVRLQSTTPIIRTARGSAGTVRLPTSTFGYKERPSILNAENDPYDMMRRSRLVSPELQPVNNILKSNKNVRAKSSSPSRSRSRTRKRSPSPKKIDNNRSRSASRNASNKRDWTDNEMDPAYRKSILRCDLNAYELISKISHNNEFSPNDDNYEMYSKQYEKVLSPSYTKPEKQIDLNVAALAGQRIRLSSGNCTPTSRPSSAVQEDVDQFVFDKLNTFDDLDSYDNVVENEPFRPPRKKSDPHTPANDDGYGEVEFILTNATLSHLSQDILSPNHLQQINSIKSILKRPASSESSEHSYNSNSIKSSSTSYQQKSAKSSISTNLTDSKKMLNGKASALLTKSTKLDGSSIAADPNRRNSGSTQFYIPMPSHRKKVQFLVENEIISRSCSGQSINENDQNSSTIISLNGCENNQTNYYNADDENNYNRFIVNDTQPIIASTPTTAYMNATNTSTYSNNRTVQQIVDLNNCINNKIEEDNDIPRSNSKTRHVLRRTLSDRRLSESKIPTPKINFIDTTALRMKNNNRQDSRDIFNENLPTCRPRPKDPPPPPPTTTTTTAATSPKIIANNKPVDMKKKIPTRPPRQSSAARRTSNVETSNDKFSSNNSDNIYEDFKFNEPTVKLILNNQNNSRNGLDLKQPNNRVAVHHATPTSEIDNIEQRKRILANIEAFQGSRIFSRNDVQNKTVVKVAPIIINRESSAIHRLEVKSNEDESNENENSRKTSILINGDECYSTINVTDDAPIYQSSVVVNSNVQMSPSITKSNSNTVMISVTTPPEPNVRKPTFEVKNNANNLRNSSCSRSIIPINDFKSITASSADISSSQTKTLITLDYNSKGSDEKEPKVTTITAGNEELILLLRNPVEAVKRNLVPHVCGKHEIHKAAEEVVVNHKISSKLLQADSASFIAKLLEDPTLGHLAEGLENEIVAKLIENSLVRLKESRNNLDMNGTKDEKDMNKLIEASLQKVKEERHKLESLTKPEHHDKLDDPDKLSNRDSISSGNSYSSANYEPYDFDLNDLSDCYQSCSSELTADEDGNMTRTKFYQMLVDATLSEIEISTTLDDDHHYESIRLNGDPIYEEINDVPPPLPLCPPPNDCDLDKKTNAKSMFEGASKYDILSYLVDAKERGIVPEDSYTYNFGNTPEIIIEEESDKVSERLGNNRQIAETVNRKKHVANVSSDSNDESSLKLSSVTQPRKTATEIERNDSGVGSETSKTSRSKYQTLSGSILNKNSPIHLCEDCDEPVETQVTESGVMFAPLVCRKCCKKRAERKEIVTEIIETEEKYGRDLQIILEEFYQPMLVAGLLTQEQLSAIFLNSEELLENSQSLADKMRDAFDIAMEQGDDDLLTVNIGKLLLDAAPMLHAFESYCIRQAAASLLLANMEKEKELLRIFLRVSQMENTVLRRMNLNSFLMVPVQRVTKYPLLLARLFKVTPAHLDGRDLLKQAQEKIELHLNHMNREAKDVPTKLWRRISSSSPGRRSTCEIDMINIKLRKMAIDLLEWNHDEVRFAIEGKLLFTQPTDNNWRKGRTIKLTPVNALLVTNGKPTASYKMDKVLNEQLYFPRNTGIREATLLLVREKSGRYTLLREPLFLDRCIVCTEADWEDYFEVQEISSKETFIFKAEDGARTKQWYSQLQYHSQGMGAWRKRRYALANIMINGMMMRS